MENEKLTKDKTELSAKNVEVTSITKEISKEKLKLKEN